MVLLDIQHTKWLKEMKVITTVTLVISLSLLVKGGVLLGQKARDDCQKV